MFSRLLGVLIAGFAVVIVLSSGWLQESHDRLGGAGIIVGAVLVFIYELRPRRRRDP